MSADLDKEGAQEGGPSETSGAASSDYDKPGVAKLKAQYILQDYRPTVDKEYVSVRDQLSMTSDTAGNHGDPPAKRVKLAGRNKKRPKGKRADPSDKICPYFLKDESCTFGDRCKYSHDKVNFMATKPKDISDVCYLFETYGKCPYGLSCRFGGQHIAENNNVVKEGHDEMKSRKDVVRNVLTKDTQVLLWKRRYDFSKADTVINEICPEANSYSRKKNDNKTTGKLPGSAQSVQEKTPPTEPVTTSTGSVTKNTDTTETSIREVPGNGAVETGVSPLDGEITVTSQCVEPNSSLETSECVTSNRPKAAAVETSTCDTLSVEQGSSGDTGTSIMVQSEGAGAQKPRLLEDEGIIKLRPQEKKKVDFAGKLYLAPLTTVGNLPFRRICKQFGADITCGEMAVCTNMLQGQSSEWALCKRHESEDIFGVQVCGAYPDSMTRCAQLINEHMDVDFVDINCGCPIDLIFNKGEGSALMGKVSKFEKIVTGMTSVLDVPLTVKIRTGIYKDRNIAHTLMPRLRDWGVSLVTLHGRSRVQRYTKTADWDYIQECAGYAAPMPVFVLRKSREATWLLANCDRMIAHLYCLAVRAGFYNDVVECLPRKRGVP